MYCGFCCCILCYFLLSLSFKKNLQKTNCQSFRTVLQKFLRNKDWIYEGQFLILQRLFCSLKSVNIKRLQHNKMDDHFSTKTMTKKSLIYTFNINMLVNSFLFIFLHIILICQLIAPYSTLYRQHDQYIGYKLFIHLSTDNKINMLGK